MSGRAGARRVTARVVALGSRGEGIVETDAGPLYLPATAPGDEVALTVRRDRDGRIMPEAWEVTRPSPLRARPACPHFGACGGCALQHVREDLYAAWITERIRRALATQGLDGFADRIAEPAISPPGSRRRLVLHAARAGSRVVFGLNARRSHRIVDLKVCPVAVPELWRTVQTLRPLLDRLAAGGPLTVTATMTDTGIDVLLAGGPPPADPDLLADLAEWAEAADVAALSWSDGGRAQRLVERRQPLVTFAGIPVPFPGGAFLQATAAGEQALQRAVADWAGGAQGVVDLFAGLGTLSLPLAEGRRILAVEGDGAAVEALGQAVAAAGFGPRFRTLHRDLFRSPLSARELDAFALAIVDPPRAGAKEQMRAIAASALPRVALISCNPNTWARDARILVDAGFAIAEIRPVAQFLWSDAVEVASLLTRESGAGR